MKKTVTPLKKPEKGIFLRGVLIELVLLISAALLFSLAFPNYLSSWGFFPLGFICFIPLVPLIHRSGWVRVCIYGFLYGLLSYSLFNFWLLKFHPLAIFIVPVIYAFYFLLLFPVFKLADTLFPRWGYIVQCIIWLGYEYLKTRGFLGYSYGIIGYSQYIFLPLVRFSSLTGVWGVSLITLYPSFFLGYAWKAGYFKKGVSGLWEFLKRHRAEWILYGAVFIGVLGYGIASKADLEGIETRKMALIQHNVDPWKSDYEASLKLLTELSSQAMKENPDMVVWSETAFVPSIEYHSKHRYNRKMYDLVLSLKEFLSAQPVPYVLGNDDGQQRRIGGDERIDYNAVFLYDGGFVDKYWKIHLVPFTENFPYQDVFPGIYNALRAADTHFWEKGSKYTVFEAAGIKFSTPICFEDTFGYLTRKFIRRGAEVIVNLTNDSWSYSTASMMQHMAMSVFRATENKRSVVRSTNGGLTCIISPNGKILYRLPTFTEGYLVGNVPIYTEEDTLYTRFGDYFGVAALFIALGLLLFGIIRFSIRTKSAIRELE